MGFVGLPAMLAKVLSAVALVAFTLGLAACGSEGDAPNGNVTTAPTSASGSTSSSSSKEIGTAEVDKAKENDSASADKQKPSSSGKADASGEAQNPNAGYKPVSPVRPLFSSNSSGIVVKDPTVVVARSNSQLNSLKSRQVAGTDDPPPQFKTSFKRNQVIAVVAPPSVSGSRLSVTSVLHAGDSTKVYAVLIEPGKGCEIAGSNNVRPTAWVETRRLSGGTSVNLVKRTSNC